MNASDTIFAPASGTGKAGIAIIRVSGVKSRKVLELICGIFNPEAKKVQFSTFKNPLTGEIIDKGITVYFAAPASYTGEDVAELQIHGGRAVIAALLKALCVIEGLRPAEAGEFSRRAVMNGKMDLTAAEGVADLINADTEEQRKQALRQLSGELGSLYESWRHGLIKILASLEAYIDFPEEDIPPESIDSAKSAIKSLSEEISSHLNDNHRGERLRDGFSIAIIGAPNAGKSSILNRLVKRDVAIVSQTAGTTRDIIEAYIDISGYPVIFADTAGLREAKEEIEAEGIKRALAKAENADLVLAVFSGDKYPFLDNETIELVKDKNHILVLNKSDVVQEKISPDLLPVSALTGEGIDNLSAKISLIVEERLSLRESPALTSIRHRQALNDCLLSLKRSINAPQLDLMAEDIRIAARSLGSITGHINVEEILDMVFKDFCIGK